MKNAKLDRFDQTFFTVFGSIGTITPMLRRFERERAKEILEDKESK